MIEAHRQLESYVKSRNNEYSISFTLKEAEELLKYISRLEVRNYNLEEALDKTIKKITLDNDTGMEFLDNQYEYWKEWCFKDE